MKALYDIIVKKINFCVRRLQILYMYMCIHVYTCTCVYMYIHVCTCMYMYVLGVYVLRILGMYTFCRMHYAILDCASSFKMVDVT